MEIIILRKALVFYESIKTSVSMSGGKWKVHGEDEDEGTFWIIRLPDTDMMIIKMHLV